MTKKSKQQKKKQPPQQSSGKAKKKAPRAQRMATSENPIVAVPTAMTQKATRVPQHTVVRNVRELIGFVKTVVVSSPQQSGVLSGFKFNPGSSNLVTLDQYGLMYEQYRILDMFFEYESTCFGINGAFHMAIDYDQLDVPETPAQLTKFDSHVVSQDFVSMKKGSRLGEGPLVVDKVRANKGTSTWLYTEPYVATKTHQDLVGPAAYWFASGATAGQTVGELYVNYSVEFKSPCASGQLTGVGGNRVYSEATSFINQGTSTNSPQWGNEVVTNVKSEGWARPSTVGNVLAPGVLSQSNVGTNPLGKLASTLFNLIPRQTYDFVVEVDLSDPSYGYNTQQWWTDLTANIVQSGVTLANGLWLTQPALKTDVATLDQGSCFRLFCTFQVIADALGKIAYEIPIGLNVPFSNRTGSVTNKMIGVVRELFHAFGWTPTPGITQSANLTSREINASSGHGGKAVRRSEPDDEWRLRCQELEARLARLEFARTPSGASYSLA